MHGQRRYGLHKIRSVVLAPAHYYYRSSHGIRLFAFPIPVHEAMMYVRNHFSLGASWLVLWMSSTSFLGVGGLATMEEEDADDVWTGFLRKCHETRSTNPPCPPSHIHWSPASNVDFGSHRVNVTVSFTLPDHPECRPSVVTPVVWYQKQKQPQQQQPPHQESWSTPEHVIPTESFQFHYSSYLRQFTSSWIHHAILPELEGGETPYWYSIQVVPTNHRNSSRLVKMDRGGAAVHNFTTPPLPSKSVRIALIADWGGSDDAVRTMKGMLSRKSVPSLPPLSAVVVAGDISYANSHLPTWEDWLETMQPLSSSTPLLVAPGNHEIECNRATFQVFQAYESYFRNPNRIKAPQVDPIPRQLSDCTHPAQFLTKYWYGNSFYSYRHGLLQIVVLNSYTNTTKGSVQYEWLKQELETRVDRKITPWLLVVFHCPLHTTFRGHNGKQICLFALSVDSIAFHRRTTASSRIVHRFLFYFSDLEDELNPNLMMQDMEPLFVQHNVNLVLSGHNHAYVRTKPMNGSQPSASGGPIYLTIGTGGESHSKGPLHPKHAESWVAHRDHTEFGYGELYVVNETHAYFERILNNGEKAHPDARDSVWIHSQNEDRSGRSEIHDEMLSEYAAFHS